MQPDRGLARAEQVVGVGGQGLKGTFQAQRRRDAAREGDGQVAQALVPFDSPIGSLRAGPFDSLSAGSFGSLRAGVFDEAGAGADVASKVTPGSSAGLCHEVERHSKMLKGKGKRTPGQRAGSDV